MSSNVNSRQRILIIVLMGLGILFTAFFGWRAFHALKRFNGHRPPPQGHVETDVELIRDWMTVPFISRMYQVREEIIFESLDIPGKENRDKSLKDLNRVYYPDADGFVLEKVRATIFENQPPATQPGAVAP